MEIDILRKASSLVQQTSRDRDFNTEAEIHVLSQYEVGSRVSWLRPFCSRCNTFISRRVCQLLALLILLPLRLLTMCRLGLILTLIIRWLLLGLHRRLQLG